MRRLSNSVPIKASESFALAFIKTDLLGRGPNGHACLALRFALPNVFIEGLTIEKVVALQLEHGAIDGNTREVSIGWQPGQTRALPSFSGILTAAAETAETCRLTIAGGYIAPGGIAGALFDSLIGVRIARATLAALLTDFKGRIEADYFTRLS